MGRITRKDTQSMMVTRTGETSENPKDEARKSTRKDKE